MISITCDCDVFQYYESLIVEARSKQECSVAEAVEQTVVNKMQELQNEIEKCEEEKSGITEVRVSLPLFYFDHCSILERFPYAILGFQVNRKLIKEQETWRKKAKEIEERCKMFALLS